MSSVLKLHRRGEWREPIEKVTVKDFKETTKHPTFDARWEEHSNFCWWWARKFVKWFGGRPDDYIGSLVLRFNRVLYYYDPTISKLTTYFSKNIRDDLFRHFIRYDSENWAINWLAQNSTDKDINDLQLNYAFHESSNQLYRIPDCDDDWALEIINNFESPAHCWEFLTRGLQERSKDILRTRYEGLTLDEIGCRHGITRERVRQIITKTTETIRERLQQLETWVHLFTSA